MAGEGVAPAPVTRRGGRRRAEWGPTGEAILADGVARDLSPAEISAALKAAGVPGASVWIVIARRREAYGSSTRRRGRSRRTDWGPEGEAMLADGVARGLSSAEISAAMKAAGIPGSSLGTVARRRREVYGDPPRLDGQRRADWHRRRRHAARESAAPSGFSETERKTMVGLLKAHGLSDAAAYRLAAKGPDHVPLREASRVAFEDALSKLDRKPMQGLAVSVPGLLQTHITARLGVSGADLVTSSPEEILLHNRAEILAKEALRKRTIAEVEALAAADRARGDVDAKACDLALLEADLRAGLARVERSGSEQDMVAVVVRLERARAAYDRLALRRAEADRPLPWPIPRGSTIYEVLSGLERGPFLESDEWRIAAIDAELARLRCAASKAPRTTSQVVSRAPRVAK